MPLLPAFGTQVNSVKKGVRFRPPEVKAALVRLELAKEHLQARGLRGVGVPASRWTAGSAGQMGNAWRMHLTASLRVGSFPGCAVLKAL